MGEMTVNPGAIDALNDQIGLQDLTNSIEPASGFTFFAKQCLIFGKAVHIHIEVNVNLIPQNTLTTVCTIPSAIRPTKRVNASVALAGNTGLIAGNGISYMDTDGVIKVSNAVANAFTMIDYNYILG